MKSATIAGVAVWILFCCQGASAVDPSTNETSQATSYRPQEAFKAGLESLEGRVDLLSKEGFIVFQRGERGCWHMSLTHYPGERKSSLRVIISDDKTVERLDRPFGRPGNSRAVEQAAKAFARVVESVREFDLFETKGRIEFHRAKDDRWFANVSGYHGAGIGGILIYVADDGNLEKLHGL